MKVRVLLSSFRGRTFIAEQIDSILKQKDVDVELIVRDDGSDDGTIGLLNMIASRDSRVEVIEGRNIGVIASFFELLTHRGDADPPFFAFADQDDIWPTDRLARQCEVLARLPQGGAALCFGGFIRVDAAGAPIDGRDILPPLPDKGALLSENQVPGCTMMINRAARDIVCANLPAPRHVFMHDWWVEQVVAFTGTIVRIDETVLYYRQHDGNLIGIPSDLGIWRDRLARTVKLRGRHPLLAQVSELHEKFGDHMSAGDKARIEHFLRAAGGGFVERLAHVFSPRFRRARRSDDLFLRLLLLTGYFRSQLQ